MTEVTVLHTADEYVGSRSTDFPSPQKHQCKNVPSEGYTQCLIIHKDTSVEGATRSPRAVSARRLQLK